MYFDHDKDVDVVTDDASLRSQLGIFGHCFASLPNSGSNREPREGCNF